MTDLPLQYRALRQRSQRQSRGDPEAHRRGQARPRERQLGLRLAGGQGE